MDFLGLVKPFPFSGFGILCFTKAQVLRPPIIMGAFPNSSFSSEYPTVLWLVSKVAGNFSGREEKANFPAFRAFETRSYRGISRTLLFRRSQGQRSWVRRRDRWRLGFDKKNFLCFFFGFRHLLIAFSGVKKVCISETPASVASLLAFPGYASSPQGLAAMPQLMRCIRERALVRNFGLARFSLIRHVCGRSLARRNLGDPLDRRITIRTNGGHFIHGG